jgi:hypothetical protein
MYMQEGEPEVRREPYLNGVVALAALATVALSLYAGPIFDWAARAVLRLLG